MRCLSLLVLVACTDGGAVAPDGAGEPDAPPTSDAAAIDAPITPVADASGIDAVIPTDAPPPIDAPPSGPPVVTTIGTVEGFTQIRQGAYNERIQIFGDNLAAFTSVTIGSLVTTIVAQSDVQIDVLVEVPHGFATGVVDVVLWTSLDTALVLPGALEITPTVIAAGAAPGGKGTFQSPTSLCDTAIEPFTGDTVLLLAGTHACSGSMQIYGGVTVQGAGTTATVVAGVGINFVDADTSPASLRDVAFSSGGVSGWNTSLVVEHVAGTGSIEIDGLSDDRHDVVIDDAHLDGGGVSLALNGSATIRNSSIRNASTCLDIDLAASEWGSYAHVVIENTRIEHCGRGLRIGTLPDEYGPDPAISIAMRNSVLHDNAVGIEMEAADLITLTNVIISDDETTLPAITTGVHVRDGYVDMVGGTMTGQDYGIDIHTSWVSDFEPHGGVSLSQGATIVGGREGISAGGLDASVGCVDSTIRDQTQVAVLIGGFDNSSAGFQNCALSVTSGVAYVDARDDAWAFSAVSAVGTTLNGVSFAGQDIEGPASAPPHYVITDNGSLHF